MCKGLGAQSVLQVAALTQVEGPSRFVDHCPDLAAALLLPAGVLLAAGGEHAQHALQAHSGILPRACGEVGHRPLLQQPPASGNLLVLLLLLGLVVTVRVLSWQLVAVAMHLRRCRQWRVMTRRCSLTIMLSAVASFQQLDGRSAQVRLRW